MKGASFVVEVFEYVVDMAIYNSDTVKAFFGSGRAEFVVLIEVYAA